MFIKHVFPWKFFQISLKKHWVSKEWVIYVLINFKFFYRSISNTVLLKFQIVNKYFSQNNLEDQFSDFGQYYFIDARHNPYDAIMCIWVWDFSVSLDETTVTEDFSYDIQFYTFCTYIYFANHQIINSKNLLIYAF